MVYLTGRAALPGDVAFEEALAGMEDKWYVGPDLLIEWLSHELPHEYSLIVCAFPVYFVYRMVGQSDFDFRVVLQVHDG